MELDQPVKQELQVLRETRVQLVLQEILELEVVQEIPDQRLQQELQGQLVLLGLVDQPGRLVILV